MKRVIITATSTCVRTLQAAISVNSEDPDADYQGGYDRLMGLVSLAVVGFALQLFCMFVHFRTATRAVVLFRKSTAVCLATAPHNNHPQRRCNTCVSDLVADVLGAAAVFWMVLDTWSWWAYICVFLLFV